jgi:hypothetical protein
MITSILTWVVVNGGSALLGVLLDAVLQFFRDKAAREAERQAGRLEVERVQAAEAARVQAEMADEAAKTIAEDEAIDRLDKGTA